MRCPLSSDRAQPATSAARLAADAGGDLAPELGADLEGWIASSGRVRAFVEDNRTKIRHKLRGAADPEAVRDTRTELLVAARLLADRRIELAFEAYGSRAAGPDFTVTFRGVTRFNVEVTRRRGPADGHAIADAVVTKLRQLPPSIANVLVVAVDRPIAESEVAGAMLALRGRVDARDPGMLARAGAASPREFYDKFLRLNAVVAWADEAPDGADAAAWPNPSAKIGLDPAVTRAVIRALGPAT